MADKWPLANGNWSDAANWNDGTKPGPNDDVFADGKTITIDEDITVASIRTTQRSGGTAGGGFTNAANRIVIAEIIGGTSTVLTHVSQASRTLSVTGNVFSGVGGSGISISGTAGSVTITGNVVGGASSNAAGITQTGTCNLRIIGDVVGGTGASLAPGIRAANTTNVELVGNITASNSQGFFGFIGLFELTGTATASSNKSAIESQTMSFGVVTVDGHLVDDAISGQVAVICPMIKVTDSPSAISHTRATVSFASRVLSTAGANQAATADVRSGVVYGGGIGTLRVPEPQYVSIGVLTDDTVGTLAVDLQPILDAIANITVDNAAIAGAVRTELATELGRIDVATSSRLAADDYVEPVTNVVVPLNTLPFKVQRNASSKLSLRRFVNFTHTINDVGSLNGANRLVFTIKESKDTEADDKSFVQVSATIPANSQTDGVLYANALPAGDSRTGGSVVVEDYTENNVAKKRVVVTIKDYVTALIPVAAEATFDLQYFTASGSFILDEGKISIENATTRSTTSA